MLPTAEQVKDFERDGFLVLDRIASPEDVAKVLAAMDRVYAGTFNDDRRPPALRGKAVTPFGDEHSVRWILNARFLDADLWRHATDARLGEIAARLLQTASVSIVEDQLLDKPASGGRPVNVHQDYGYWPFSTSTKMISCWIALVDVTLDHGPVQLLRGSHRWGLGSNPKELIRGSEQDWLAAADCVRPTGETLDVVPVTVPAGGGVFFHALTFHGSPRNTTPACRRACSLHWASAECRMDREKTRSHDYPYMFARIDDGARLVNKYLPQVFPAP